MPFQLPPLPYALEALEPHVSARTMSFHHGKHHAAYVKKLNELVQGTPLAERSLEEIVRATSGDASRRAIFNNAAQSWNHAFFWKCMRPRGGGAPSGELRAAVDAAFGSVEAFKKEFAEAAVAQFGTGWAWLTSKDGRLAVRATEDAETPLTEGATPLLTLDVWEHAYYLDYQNRRPDFVEAFLDHLVDWEFASDNFARA
jgi:Fe-Mn family superoxide dismutase